MPAAVTATLLGGAGGDTFDLRDVGAIPPGPPAGNTVEFILGQVIVSPAGDEAGASDILSINDFSDSVGGQTIVVTGTGIEGITGYTGAGDDIVYNLGDLIEVIGINTSNQAAAGEIVNIQSTQLGSQYSINTSGGDDTVNISSDAGTNAGNLNAILGRVRLETGAGEDTLNMSDFGDTVGDTFTIAKIGGPGPARTAVDFSGAALVNDVVYNDLGPATLEHFLLVGSNDLAASNVYNVNATTATMTNTITDGDATNTGSGNDATFTIVGDNLSANNLFQGFDGNDQFTVNITVEHRQTMRCRAARSPSVQIEGNANPAVDATTATC